MWISLRSQLEAEHVIRDSQTDDPHLDQQRASACESCMPGGTVFQRPALAGAFLSVILFAASRGYFPKRGAPQMAVHPQFAPQQESSPVLSADSIFKEEMLTVGNDGGRTPTRNAKRDTAVADSIRRNLGVVDKFIALCEKSVREQPDNEMAREYLYGAYQEKADLLATAMNRSVPGGLQ